MLAPFSRSCFSGALVFPALAYVPYKHANGSELFALKTVCRTCVWQQLYSYVMFKVTVRNPPPRAGLSASLFMQLAGMPVGVTVSKTALRHGTQSEWSSVHGTLKWTGVLLHSFQLDLHRETSWQIAPHVRRQSRTMKGTCPLQYDNLSWHPNSDSRLKEKKKPQYTYRLQ